ncbi:MAG TPA: DUF6174 domain-containing protein [Aggregatilineales bacterium]|nr:DUF6174 domain-containing protein [Aggregatilineales bacterium]
MWSLRGARDYNITLSQGGYANTNPYLLNNTDAVVEVRNGQVVAVFVDRKPSSIAPDKYGDSTVEGLFNKAWGALFSPFIDVRYNPSYGYPESVAGGFIESGGVWVKDIQFGTATPSFAPTSSLSP